MAYQYTGQPLGYQDPWLLATGRGRTVTPKVQQRWGIQPVQARSIDREQRGENLRQLIDWRREQSQRQQPQLASMIQQPPLQLGTFGTPAPQQYQPLPQPQQQPKPKYDWQQPQTPTLQPGQPLPPTQQFGYAQPYAQQRQPLSRPYSYGQPQWPGGQPRPRQPQFGGLSQYFNY